MNNGHLATYLNDPLSGAVTALDLLEYLESHVDSISYRLVADLKAEVSADRAELEKLMDEHGVSQSLVRKVAGWFTEKVTAWKLHLDDKKGGSFSLFEALEALSLGIEGRRLLWRALSIANVRSASFEQSDFERLKRRAERQRTKVEALRLLMSAR
jgi:hypothetical protein